MLEQKEGDRSSFTDNSNEFLHQSDVQVSFHHDVMAEFDRVYELINRSNQLNFTKLRLSEDRTIARQELGEPLATVHDRHAGYIKVSDRYGYYGIIGFYMVKAQVLEHFTFSCRTLGMGIEQYVYMKLGRPRLKIVGDVVSDPLAGEDVDWITVVDDAEQRTARAGTPLVSICVRGACELSQSSHYLRQRFSVIEEFPFPYRGWGINVPLTQYAVLRQDLARPANRVLLETLPGLHPKCIDSVVFSRSADVYVLSFSLEQFIGYYRFKPTGTVIPLALGHGMGQRDLTTMSYEEIRSKSRLDRDEAWWHEFCATFQHVGFFNAARFRQSLQVLFSYLDGKHVIIVHTNTRHGPYSGINRMNAEINDIVDATVGHLAWRIISMNDLIADDKEVVSMDHFRRDVYMRLADAITAAIGEVAMAFDSSPALYNAGIASSA